MPGAPGAADPKPDVTEVTMPSAPGRESHATEVTMPAAPGASGDDVERTVVMASSPVSKIMIGDFQPGDHIDRYVIVKTLGRGGMGCVYLARHETLGAFRAVKVLSGALYHRGGEFVRRFMQEARIACAINHPNIVNVVDVGEDAERGFCYIVMEYVDGGTVRDVLKRTSRLSELHAVLIAEAVAEALNAAAEQKIVHRDIKPDNIMLTRRGEV